MTKITIYSTTTCAYCHMEKEYLDSKGITYDEIVVDKDPSRIPELLDTCGSMGVPCTHIVKDDGSEEKILGFDKSKLDAVLGLS